MYGPPPRGDDAQYGMDGFNRPYLQWQSAQPYAAYANSEIVKRLRQAVNAEYNAIRTYGHLAEIAPNEEFKQILLSIQADETRHFHMFSSIYTQLTGERPALEGMSSSALPSSFDSGVDESITDELRDSKFYQETTHYTSDSRIQWSLLYASFDEARHATWFSYMWNRLGDESSPDAEG